MGSRAGQGESQWLARPSAAQEAGPQETSGFVSWCKWQLGTSGDLGLFGEGWQLLASLLLKCKLSGNTTRKREQWHQWDHSLMTISWVGLSYFESVSLSLNCSIKPVLQGYLAGLPKCWQSWHSKASLFSFYLILIWVTDSFCPPWLFFPPLILSHHVVFQSDGG